MYLIMIIANGVPNEIILLTPDRAQAETQFLNTCETNISDWSKYSFEDIQNILDVGYIETPGIESTICFLDLTNCIIA